MAIMSMPSPDAFPQDQALEDRPSDIAFPVRLADIGEPPEPLVRQFVEHWGGMARAWGINPTMGELFALLYITARDWHADELRERLGVSRANVSMNLRELLVWGIIHKVHYHGQRKEFYRAEVDVWVLFQRIMTVRKRRELDPTLAMLQETASQIPSVDPALTPYRDRVLKLSRFFDAIGSLASRLSAIDPEQLDAIRDLLETLGAESP